MGYHIELSISILRSSLILDHRLTLKTGSTVMILQNLQAENGHVSETLYIIFFMTEKVLHQRAVPAKCRNKRFILSYIPCDPVDEDFSLPGFSRELFPVRIFFAITTNKAQRQLFEEALGIVFRRE